MKLRNLKTAVLLLTLVCLTAMFSCNKDDKQPYFRIKIDSIVAPDTAITGDSIGVSLYGYIGPNKCYAFDNAIFYQRNPELNEIMIEAYGEVVDNNGLSCKEEEAFLDRSIGVFMPETVGTYTFKAVYDGDTITATRKIILKEKPDTTSVATLPVRLLH